LDKSGKSGITYPIYLFDACYRPFYGGWLKIYTKITVRGTSFALHWTTDFKRTVEMTKLNILIVTAYAMSIAALFIGLS